MWDVEEVKSEINNLLLQSGFDPDHFIIKEDFLSILVLFDMKAAVDYFKGDFESSELSEKYRFRYHKDGKRHCAMIYFKG